MKIGQKPPQMPPPQKAAVQRPQFNGGSPPGGVSKLSTTGGATNPFSHAPSVQGNLSHPVPPPGVGGKLQVHA